VDRCEEQLLPAAGDSLGVCLDEAPDLPDTDLKGINGDEFWQAPGQEPVHGELIKSCGDWSLVQPSTIPLPRIRIEIHWGCRSVGSQKLRL
jgi:hypothetical protein